MDEEGVAKFLIEKRYNLTALELMAEIYERSGMTIPALSTYFQDSANFLTFDTSVAISEVIGESMEDGSSETLRIKNDKIALLEHEISVLKDQLKEAGNASEQVEKKSLRRSTMSCTASCTRIWGMWNTMPRRRCTKEWNF